MSDNKYLLAIGATILIMALLFYKDKKEKASAENKPQEVQADFKKTIKPVVTKPAERSSSDISMNTIGSVPASSGSSQASELVQQNFSVHLKAMAKCFSLAQQSVISDKIEPHPENLLNHLRTSLGDMVVQMDDWSQTEFIEKDGSIKRVRVDYDYPDGATPVRRLSMYKINSYNRPEIVDLTPDESNNPNEAYIISLTEGQNVTTEEKGVRAYYAEGEELIYTTQNGRLQNLSISKADHTFSCSNLADETSNCVCQ